MTDRVEADRLLEMIRDELVAQRAVMFHLVDLITLRGGPDRDEVADHLERLQLFLPGEDEGLDVLAMNHLRGIANQLRKSGRGNVFKIGR